VKSGIFLVVIALFASVLTALSCSDPSCEESGTCAAPAGTSGGTNDGGGSSSGDPDAAPVVGDFDMSATAPASILVGAKGDLEITITRTGARSITGPVTVTLEAQTGLSASPLVIPGESATAKMELTVAADRKHGDPKIVLKGVGAGDKKSEARPATLIRGLPGTLDTSFGVDGTFTFDKPTSEATGVVVQADGKIVLGGKAGMDLALFQLNDDGTLDTTFNAGATTIKPPGNGLLSTSDLVADKNGSVAILFELDVAQPTPQSDILRVTKTGVLDNTFGTSGIAKVDIEQPSALTLASDGTFYVGGRRPGGNPGNFVRHLQANGSLDMAWGGGTGFFFYASPAPCDGSKPTANCRTRALVIEAAGTLVACQPRNDGAYVNRINANGTTGNLFAYTSLLLDDCGSLAPHSNQDFAYAGGEDQGNLVVRRLTADGVTDAPYGNDQSNTQYRAPANTSLKFARRLANVDGKLVIGAQATDGGVAALSIARLTPLGVLDTTLAGGAGYFTFKVGGKASTLMAMAIDSAKGRVIVAGTNGNLIAARLWL
jgi:uncharacterized delta-60 repeat protein